MFSIPRKLSTSLGIIGDDPKLAFRTQASGLRRLLDVRNIPATDDRYWSQYVTLFDSSSDVYSLISPHDIRRVLNEAPENLATLINYVSNKLFTLRTDHTFPTPPTSTFSPVANVAAAWASVSGTEARDTTKELLNCLRVLGRVLPVVYEAEGRFEQQVLWTRRRKATPATILEEEPSEPQFVIQEEDSDEEDEPRTARPSVPPVATSPAEELEPPLADKLLTTSIELLFCCGFTLPTKIQVDHHKINYTIWEKGIGSTQDLPSSSHLDQNKVEVLKFLEILLSKTMYISPSQVLTEANPYIERLVHNHQTPRRLVLPILCSLLNTAMNTGAKPAPGLVPNMGNMINGMGDMVKELPYNHLVWRDESHIGAVTASIGVLVALLDYQAGSARDASIAASGTTTPVSAFPGPPTEGPRAPTATTNAFRYFLAKLHRPSDLDYILNGILGTLENHMNAVHNLLPGSRKGVPYILETFLLLWKVIELNKKFRAHVMESNKIRDLMMYLLWFALEHKEKPQHHGLCRTLSYIIQHLSSEPGFGPKLAQPIPSRIAIPVKWATQGTVADFFVTSVYYMVATTGGQLNFTYPAFLISLANAAPYIQNLGVPASTRLLQLYTAFSNPSFLLADEGHPRLLFFTLEILNQIIYYQFQSNPNVTYAILRAHKKFESLGTFTLAKGLREIQRIKEAKEQAERIKAGQSPIEKGKSTATPNLASETPSVTSLDDESVGKTSLSRTSSEAALQSPRDEDPEQRQFAVPPTPTIASDRSFANLRLHSSRSSVVLSEKARGKLREQNPSSPGEDYMDPELERIAAAGVGRNGFVPTQEWVTSWQQGLPLDTILLVISELLPKVTEIQNSNKHPNGAAAIIDYLKVADLREVLPTAPGIHPRKFQWTEASLIWLSSLIWGEIFVKGSTPLAIWNATNVKLFGVRQTPSTRSVSNIVGGLLGGGGSSTGAPSTPSEPTPGHSRRASRVM